MLWSDRLESSADIQRRDKRKNKSTLQIQQTTTTQAFLALFLNNQERSHIVDEHILRGSEFIINKSKLTTNYK